MKLLETFTRESEAERRKLFDQIRVDKLDSNYRYLAYTGILPLTLPDGIRVVILGDVHAPAHHKQIFKALLKFIEWYRPHIVIVPGDLCDVFSASMWAKNPRTPVDPQGEIEESADLILELIRHGALWVIVFEGNHEDRNPRWIMEFAPQFAHYLDPTTREPVLSLYNLMGFGPDDPVTFISGEGQRGGREGGLWINDHIGIIHGSMSKKIPGASAQGHAKDTHTSMICGHTHREGSSALPSTGNVIVSVELGCLVDWDHPYMAYAPRHNWHHGFAVGTVFGGKLHAQPIPIIGGQDKSGQYRHTFVFDGKVFQTIDR